MNTMAKQRGVTAIGWLVILGLIGFFVFIGLKLFPIYTEYFNVVSSLKSLQNEPEITRKTKQDITAMIMKRFQVNDVKNAKRSCLDITKRSGVLTVTCSYSVSTELFGPLSLVADFEESVEVVAN